MTVAPMGPQWPENGREIMRSTLVQYGKYGTAIVLGLVSLPALGFVAGVAGVAYCTLLLGCGATDAVRTSKLARGIALFPV